MEEQIKKTAASVKRLYLLFWLLPVVSLGIGEGSNVTGAFASQPQYVYLAETLAILSTALCVPFSLKMFAQLLARRINKATLPVALRMYVRGSALRLLLLAVPVVVGFFTYYGMLSSKGLLCALIGLTASLFCLPSEQRLRRELQIEKEESDPTD